MSSNQPSHKRKNDSSGCSNKNMKVSKLPSSDSSSQSASNSEGFNDILKHNRSVLYHPFALMMVWAVESGNVSSKFNDLMEEMFPGCQKSVDTINQMRDNTGFTDCYENWLGDEIELTNSLAEMIKATEIARISDLDVIHGRTDLQIIDRRDSHPLMVIEVGFNNNDWWKKYDLASRYMRTLVFDSTQKSPILLTVLTISSKKEKEFEAKLGMFMLVPCLSNNDDYRVILIWRKQYSDLDDSSTSLDDLSKSFSTVLVAASFLSKLRDTVKIENYKILGPNCCKVDDKVLRVYDNRMLNTERRPDIYLIRVPNVVDKAEVVCDLCDENSVESLFGINNEEDADRMWKLKGRLLVISTPFYKGRHWAQSPTDFVPIIMQLQTLHDMDYVHGDIRGSNVVFNEGSGTIIDFDFGGKIGEALLYPVGYRQELFDGSRRGKAGKAITKEHDWYALIRLIFIFHVLKPPELSIGDAPSYPVRYHQERFDGSQMGEAAKEITKKHDWYALIRSIFSFHMLKPPRLSTTTLKIDIMKYLYFFEYPGPDLTKLYQDLLRFLENIDEKGWKVRPLKTYRDNLIEFGCMKGSDPVSNQRQPSKIVTGSPQKLG